MLPEEMQRTMQFLLASQAQFAADFERLSIKVDGLAGKVDGLTDKVAGVTDAVARLITVAGHTLAAVGDLAGTVERVGGTVERLVDAERRTDARLTELAEQGKATDARLGALIDLFERHLREDHRRGRRELGCPPELKFRLHIPCGFSHRAPTRRAAPHDVRLHMPARSTGRAASHTCSPTSSDFAVQGSR
jgi:hypothetical protein